VLSGHEAVSSRRTFTGDACRLWAYPLYSRIWRFEIPADLSSQMLVDLAVTRNGRDFSSIAIDIDRMPTALP
jgi:hypothetical protein